MAEFTVTDKRGSGRRLSSSPLVTSNLNEEMSRLRKSGHALPYSQTEARREAQNIKASVNNKTLTQEMRRSRARTASTIGTGSGGSNLQVAVPKVRKPMSSLADKDIPYDVNDMESLQEIRRWCNTPDAPVWMGDFSFKPMGEIEAGEYVIGWTTDPTKKRSGRRKLTKTKVLAVNKRIAPEVVKITFESGRVVKCTPDHEWLRYHTPNSEGYVNQGPDKGKRLTSDYAPLEVGSVARHVITPVETLTDPQKIYAAGYLGAMIDGEGNIENGSGACIHQSPIKNPDICERITKAFETLGIPYRTVDKEANTDAFGKPAEYYGVIREWSTIVGREVEDSYKKRTTRENTVKILNWCKPAKFQRGQIEKSLLTSNFGTADTVVSIESLGPGEVVSMQTETGNYTAWGFASKNCRLFYTTHDLVPLLVDIYAEFPVTGFTIESKDPEIKDFYESMFFDTLDYDVFLQDLGREYWISGEVTSLAHFSEELGVWSSEEILNPDTVRVSKSIFRKEERVQLLVKDVVERLKSSSMGDPNMTESERLERNWEYQQLVKYYPEMIQAADRGDGLDLADALVSRIVNRSSPWDQYGTPHMLRSFRTLMMEESLNAAQDAVSDRLYSPFILATLGVPNLGDGEAWIPTTDDLDDARDDMQQALAADFRLMVHNFGLDVKSVFGRESVPRFDQDYSRIEEKLLQAWGIGKALISGGTGGSGTYASSAINREFVTQKMTAYQNRIRKHILKRAEVIAEAQEHYDYELSGGIRKPIYREIIDVDEETGEEYIRKVPKLLLPEIKFSTLNLRDEAQERQFLQTLKNSGVPVSDGALSVNIPISFEQELEKQSEESVQKYLAQAQAMEKAAKTLREHGLPLPPELAEFMSAQEKLRVEEEAVKQIGEEMDQGKIHPSDALSQIGGGGSGVTDTDNNPLTTTGPGGEATQALDGLQHPDTSGNPTGGTPGGAMSGSEESTTVELPRNQTRPEESDEMRSTQPVSARSKLTDNPSSYGFAQKVDRKRVANRVTGESIETLSDLLSNEMVFSSLNLLIDEREALLDFYKNEFRTSSRDDTRIADLEDIIEQYDAVYGVRLEWQGEE